MGLQDAINQKIQIRFINLPEELVGISWICTGIYNPNDRLLAKLVDKDNLAIIRTTAVRSRILGLNASIVAARSGEHGKGIAVVANEVKKWLTVVKKL